MSIKKYLVACTRKRPIWSSTDTGRTKIIGYTDTSIKGYKGTQNDVVERIAGKPTIKTQYKFFCNDFNIQMGDYIDYEGKTYYVVSDPKNTAHKNHHILVWIEKVEQIKQY